MGIIYNDNWSVASVFDAAGNVVQMNTLIGGGETGFTTEPINQEVTSGDYQSGERNTLMLASAELDGAEQLAEWVANGTPVAAVALSTGQNGRNYLWQGYRKLSEKINHPKAARSEADGFLKVVLLSDTVEPKRPVNLFTAAEAMTILLPVSGIELTFTAPAPIAEEITLEILDFDDNVLETVTEEGTGLLSLKVTTPPETWKIKHGTVGGAPALTANGSTTWTPY